jgi:hypothetical protein
MRMDFEDVFVSADDMYQIMQRIYAVLVSPRCFVLVSMRGGLTTSFGDTGALRASAISCALAVTLPLREWICLIASLRLRCLPCLGSAAFALPSDQETWFSLRGCLFSLLLLFIGLCGLDCFPFACSS